MKKITKKAIKAKKKIKKMREKGAKVVTLSIKKVDGGKEKYLIKKLDVKVSTTEHKTEIRFQAYKPGKEKDTFVPDQHVKIPLDTVKDLKPKKMKKEKKPVKKASVKKPQKKVTVKKAAEKKTAKK